jgi:hypothetical protein
MQPGQTITPGQQSEPETQQNEQTSVIATTSPQPTPAQEASVVNEEGAAPESPAITPQDTTPTPAETQNGGVVQWTASEYVDHTKGPAWFVLMGLGLFGTVALVYFLLKDIFAAALLGLAGITFAVFAGRRPQVLQYSISPQGISIGQRTHAFEDFKSFSLTESGPLPAILLLPLRRFLPPITIFYDPREEDKIIEALADYLPHEEREPDVVDRLMSRIRF